MFLHLLEDKTEQTFFLNFVYLLAVAEKEDNISNIPILAHADNPGEGEYAFEEFAPGFSMQTCELLMLRKFAEEMGITWPSVSSYSSLSVVTGIAEKRFKFLPGLNLDAALGALKGQGAKSSDSPEVIVPEISVAGMLKNAARIGLNNTFDRTGALKLVLDAIFTQANATTFAVEKKKAILFEATAMAYADGFTSDIEQELLILFCDLCKLDKELIGEFSDITKEFFKIYSKSFELITE